MSSFFKNSQSRSYFPISALLLNQTHTASQSQISTSCQKPASTALVKGEKHNNQLTDLKRFREKYGVQEALPPLSCFRLIQTPSPKLFISLNELNHIDLPVLSYTLAELISFSKLVIEATPERRAIGKAFNLGKLLSLISEGYNVTAYHNFTHAFSLLLLLFQAYNRCPLLQKMLTQKEWLYVFIAALAHDLKHPGTSNAFEVKKKTPLALEAGSIAVLEKMHLNQLWSIIKKNSQVNFLQGYASYEASHIKQLITRMVFSTDVATHFKSLDALKSLTAFSSQLLQGPSAMVLPPDPVSVEQLFHACDIGNPCLDFNNYMNWSSLVSYKFDQIAKKEQQLGLAVTGFLKYDNVRKFYQGQVGFIKALVFSLWKQLEVSMPGLQEMLANVENNIVELQRRSQDEKHCGQVESGHL